MSTVNNETKSIPQRDATGAGSYNKILALYYSQAQGNVFGKQKKAIVGFKTEESFESTIKEIGSGNYQKMAGGDLANIFYPFQTRYGSGIMPSFHIHASGTLYTINSGVIVNNTKLYPFKYNTSDTSYIYYRPALSSGHDSLGNLISSNRYYGNTNTYRDISDIRSIGLRLPLMAVGWGFTNDGLPVPSQNDTLLYGSGVNSFTSYKFKGGSTNGYDVDPNDYIAAPVDLRYDPQRNVWTGPRGFWAQIISGSGVFVTSSGVFAGNGSGLITAYSWREVAPADNGDFIQPPRFRTGTYNNFPAFEVNNNTVASGTIVYFPPKEREDRYHFAVGGGSSSGTLSTGQYQYQVYQMVAQNSAGWDFVRGHPVLE